MIRVELGEKKPSFFLSVKATMISLPWPASQKQKMVRATNSREGKKVQIDFSRAERYRSILFTVAAEKRPSGSRETISGRTPSPKAIHLIQVYHLGSVTGP